MCAAVSRRRHASGALPSLPPTAPARVRGHVTRARAVLSLCPPPPLVAACAAAPGQSVVGKRAQRSRLDSRPAAGAAAAAKRTPGKGRGVDPASSGSGKLGADFAKARPRVHSSYGRAGVTWTWVGVCGSVCAHVACRAENVCVPVTVCDRARVAPACACACARLCVLVESGAADIRQSTDGFMDWCSPLPPQC
jgi:hypothetical protein